MDFYGYGPVRVVNLKIPHVTNGLWVGCDGLCMVRVVKMPARDIAIFWILSERRVAVSFGVTVSLKIIGLESESKISHSIPL